MQKTYMKKHTASSYDRRTSNVRQSYGSRTNLSYDSRKTVLRIRTAAVRIRTNSFDGRANIVRLPCELCLDAAICLRSACDLDRTNLQGNIYRTADVNKA